MLVDSAFASVHDFWFASALNSSLAEREIRSRRVPVRAYGDVRWIAAGAHVCAGGASASDRASLAEH